MSLSQFMYKTSKISTTEINDMASKPQLESVLDKTGRIDPEDFYKTNQIFLKDIDKALIKQAIEEKASIKAEKIEEKNKGQKVKKVLVLTIVVLIVGTMLASIFL